VHMKRFLSRIAISFVMMAVPLVSAFAGITDPQQEFNRGNYYYEQREFAAALAIYEQIAADGYRSGPLALNTGLTWMQLREPGRALFYFMQAREYQKTHNEAVRAIEFTEEQIFRQYAEPPVLATFVWYEWLHFRIGWVNLLLTGLLLLNVAAGFWVVHWFVTSNRILFRYSAFLLFGISVVLSGAGILVMQAEGDWKRGMIVEPGHSLMSQPVENAEPVLQLSPGFRMLHHTQRSAEAEGWSFVSMSNGLEGWVRQESLLLFPS
jgi:tetratricopeptide (TPR) repeat protein